MGLSLRIVPGQSVGPFRLGMTRSQVAEATRSLGLDSLDLVEVGIDVKFTDGEHNWDPICNRIEVLTMCDVNSVELFGRRMNHITREGAMLLFKSLGYPVIEGYSCDSVFECGIEAVRWEHSEIEVFAFFIIPPESSAGRKPDAVFGSGTIPNFLRKLQETNPRKFCNVRTALMHVTYTLIPAGHGYIVNTEAPDFDAPRIQVVAQGMIDDSNANGLSVHLPFDIDSGEHDNFMRFIELELSSVVNRKDVEGIPCFYLNFGTDFESADRAILQLLVQLYQYAPSDELECEVYDEGLMTQVQPRQAPPGGTVV